MHDVLRWVRAACAQTHPSRFFPLKRRSVQKRRRSLVRARRQVARFYEVTDESVVQVEWACAAPIKKLGFWAVNSPTCSLGDASSSGMLARYLGNHYKKIAYDRIT